MWKWPSNKWGQGCVTTMGAVTLLLGQAYPPPGVDPVGSGVDTVGLLSVATVARCDEVAGVCCSAH